jgi:cardiolipin synthase A/B
MSRVTAWRFTTSSEDAWQQMIEACNTAETSIAYEQFILGHDERIVEELGATLMRRAREGVRVQLLLDAIGSFLFSQSNVRAEWESAGIEILFHVTVIPTSLQRIIPAFLRDHRKLLVIDEREAHIGGVIVEERARSWRDTNVILTGPIVEECVQLFRSAWEKTLAKKPLGAIVSNNGKGDFFLLGNSFRPSEKLLYSSMVKNIATAKSYINITTPYLMLTYGLRRALLYALRNDVTIQLLLPRRSDNFLSDIVGRVYYRELLNAGVHIFHYTNTILHAKTLSVDGTWSTVGSSNLDWLSIMLNYELNLVSTNKEFIQELDDIFQHDVSESIQVKKEMGKWWGFFEKRAI